MTKKLVVPSLALLAMLALGAGCAVHAHPGHVAVRPVPVRVHVPPPPRVHVRVAPRRCSHVECRRVCNMWGCHDRCRRVHHACY